MYKKRVLTFGYVGTLFLYSLCSNLHQMDFRNLQSFCVILESSCLCLIQRALGELLIF